MIRVGRQKNAGKTLCGDSSKTAITARKYEQNVDKNRKSKNIHTNQQKNWIFCIIIPLQNHNCGVIILS